MDLIKTIDDELFREEYKPLPGISSNLICEPSNDVKNPFQFGALRKQEQPKQEFKLVKVDDDLILRINKDLTNHTYHLKSTGIMSIYPVDTLSIPFYCFHGVLIDASIISQVLVLLVRNDNNNNYHTLLKYSFEGNGYAFLEGKVILDQEFHGIGTHMTLNIGNNVNMLVAVWEHQKLFTVNYDNENRCYVLKCIAIDLGGNNIGYDDQIWFINNKHQVSKEKYHCLDLRVNSIVSITKVDNRYCLLFCLQYVDGDYGVVFFNLVDSRFEFPVVLQTRERINYAFVSCGMICIMFDERYYIKRLY